MNNINIANSVEGETSVAMILKQWMNAELQNNAFPCMSTLTPRRNDGIHKCPPRVISPNTTTHSLVLDNIY